MRRSLLSLLSAMMLIGLLVSPAAAKQSNYEALQPGAFVTLKQNIPVNMVFIGYNGIDHNQLRAQLPRSYEPVVRYPQFYGLNGRDMGLHFDFRYHTVNTNSAFEDRFFGYLKSIGKSGPLTDFQQQYNDQEKNVLDVTGPVAYIDAPSVEKWLASNTNELGIDPDHSYTIYYINWYGRKDFKFHVYTKTDEPDPDTGYNFGVQRATRKLIAWGGSYGRNWFYDLSAGPEANTDNWNVDTPDLDGNGIEDYRMPPIWEYTKKGYRDPSKLSSDLGKVARYVGIDILFTPSPLYDPLVTAPGVGGAKIAYINMFEDDPNTKGADQIDIQYARRQWRNFEPYYKWGVHLKDQKLTDGALRALEIWGGVRKENDCWNSIGVPDAELFCYFAANRAKYIPPFNRNDYVEGMFAFNTTDEKLGPNLGLLGFADDDWATGTQSFVFEFDYPTPRNLGYGFTQTTVHEFGHHLGLSHPHDGYDSEKQLDFEAADALYFTWSGDESNTVMHYLKLSNSFGQFNRDSMYRYETAGYLNWSNALLGDILDSGKADMVRDLLAAADRHAKEARDSFNDWDYLSAVTHARQAYETLATAADKVAVSSQHLSNALKALPNPTVPHEGDPIRFPNN